MNGKKYEYNNSGNNQAILSDYFYRLIGFDGSCFASIFINNMVNQEIVV